MCGAEDAASRARCLIGIVEALHPPDQRQARMGERIALARGTASSSEARWGSAPSRFGAIGRKAAEEQEERCAVDSRVARLTSVASRWPSRGGVAGRERAGADRAQEMAGEAARIETRRPLGAGQRSRVLRLS